MNVKEIIDQFQSLTNESIKKVLIKHGAREPFYGVKIEDLKKIQKKIKKDYKLSLELYKTGISDAMYLAGLIADETKMTKDDLRSWVEGAYWYMISEYTVPWIASESRFGWELGNEWIESPKEKITSAGWATLASIIAITPNEDLKISEIRILMKRIAKDIGKSANRVTLHYEWFYYLRRRLCKCTKQ